jgi:prevent-host-death family protein
VGAHEFRNRFGWFMQRAAAGERFLVTRRNKPFARLLPP